MNIYEKALATGLDARQVELAQAPFDTNIPRTIDIHEAHDRVLIHAAAYDAGGTAHTTEGGLVVGDDWTTLWRRVPPAILPEVRRKWTLDEDAMKRSGKYEIKP